MDICHIMACYVDHLFKRVLKVYSVVLNKNRIILTKIIKSCNKLKPDYASNKNLICLR